MTGGGGPLLAPASTLGPLLPLCRGLRAHSGGRGLPSNLSSTSAYIRVAVAVFVRFQGTKGASGGPEQVGGLS